LGIQESGEALKIEVGKMGKLENDRRRTREDGRKKKVRRIMN
jgi:hypothetical protein